MPQQRSRALKLLDGSAFLLIVAFLLVGRWSPARLGEGAVDLLPEPRLIIAVILPLLLLIRAAIAGVVYAPAGQASTGAVLLLMLTSYLAVTSAWAYDPALAQDKIVDLALVLVVALCAYVLRAQSENMDLAAIAAVALALPLALLALSSATGGAGRLAILGGGPITLGRLMGVLFLAAMTLALRRRSALLWPGVCLIAAVPLTLTGSRGAMLATAVAVIVAVVACRTPLRLAVLGVLLVGVAGYFTVTFTVVGRGAVAAFERRVLQLTVEERHVSGRDQLFEEAVNLWVEEPVFGAGLASFTGRGHGAYPHNIVLEVLTDGGLLAGLLLLALGGTWVSRRRVAPRDPFATAAVALFAVASQASGDIFDNRALFIFGALLYPRQPGPSCANVSRAVTEQPESK